MPGGGRAGAGDGAAVQRAGRLRHHADRWHFAVADHDRDGVADVLGIKNWGDSGRVEVQVLSGSSSYCSGACRRSPPCRGCAG